MGSNFIGLEKMRNLRACMVCSVVQTYHAFMSRGCPNCEAFLELTGHADSVADCTSQVFEGLITIAKPAESWVARWNRLEGYVGGVYACKVVGALPTDILQNMEESGISYMPRDGTAEDEDY